VGVPRQALYRRMEQAAVRLVGDDGGAAVIRDLDGGAKLLRLTRTLLDPKKKADLAKLESAYKQFPGIGRIAPVKE